MLRKHRRRRLRRLALAPLTAALAAMWVGALAGPARAQKFYGGEFWRVQKRTTATEHLFPTATTLTMSTWGIHDDRGTNMSIEYTDDKGRKHPDMASMLRATVDEHLDETYSGVERAVKRTVCPVHNEVPTVRRQRTGTKTRIEIESCCEENAARARAAAQATIV